MVFSFYSRASPSNVDHPRALSKSDRKQSHASAAPVAAVVVNFFEEVTGKTSALSYLRLRMLARRTGCWYVRGVS
jgi:hypothetical protein